MSLIQSAEGLKRKTGWHSRRRENFAYNGLQTGAVISALPWVSSLPFCSADLEPSRSLYLCSHLSICLSYTHTHTSHWFCFSAEHWLKHGAPMRISFLRCSWTQEPMNAQSHSDIRLSLAQLFKNWEHPFHRAAPNTRRPCSLIGSTAQGERISRPCH